VPLSTGQVLNNRYRIVKLLGQGGFGAVYRAWDTSFEMACALKENIETTPEAQRQFVREARMLRNIKHPNLPLVADYFLLPGQGQYLVMDYVEGEDLQEKLSAAGGPLPEAQVVAWMAQICDALAYLHTQNPPIIHRDIKPANIKITPQGQAVLVDFGIAKVYDPHLKTTMGARAVTPGYSPPEQYGAGVTDARTDIYALGATLYTLLTGQLPLESVQRTVGQQMPTPRVLNPRLSTQTEAAIIKALQVVPEQRHQSAAALRLALGKSTPPPPVPMPPKMQEQVYVSQQRFTPRVAAPAIVKPQVAVPTAKKPSYWAAIGLHLLCGFGLYYVDRSLKRKWIYPASCIAIFFLLLTYSMSPTNDIVILLFTLALMVYLGGFVDVILACRDQRQAVVGP
jgi:serine/threonine protein kinase